MINRFLKSLNSKSYILYSRRAQVMIITVLTLGGTILGATTIAGLLMLYQIRQATDLASSAKAIFAADAGIEWGYYQFACDPDPLLAAKWPGCDYFHGEDTPKITFSQPPDGSGANVQLTCYDNNSGQNPSLDCDSGKDNQVRGITPEILAIKSIGESGGSKRAFFLCLRDCGP